MTQNANVEARLSVRVAPHLKTRLARLAEQERRSLADYVRLVLEDHVDKEKNAGAHRKRELR